MIQTGLKKIRNVLCFGEIQGEPSLVTED